MSDLYFRGNSSPEARSSSSSSQHYCTQKRGYEGDTNDVSLSRPYSSGVSERVQLSHHDLCRIHTSTGFSSQFGALPSLQFHFPAFTGSYSQQCLYSARGMIDQSITRSPFTASAQKFMKSRVLARGKLSLVETYQHGTSSAACRGFVLELGWNRDMAAVALFQLSHTLNTLYPQCCTADSQVQRSGLAAYMALVTMYKSDQWYFDIHTLAATRISETANSDQKILRSTILVPTGFLSHVLHIFLTKFPTQFLQNMMISTCPPVTSSRIQYVLSLATHTVTAVSLETPKCVEGVLQVNLPRQRNVITRYGPYHLVFNDPALLYSQSVQISTVSTELYQHFGRKNSKFDLLDQLTSGTQVSVREFTSKLQERRVNNCTMYDLCGMTLPSSPPPQSLSLKDENLIVVNSGPRVYLRVNANMRKVRVSRRCESSYTSLFHGSPMKLDVDKSKNGNYVISCYFEEIIDGSVLSCVSVQSTDGKYLPIGELVYLPRTVAQCHTYKYLVVSAQNKSTLVSIEQVDAHPYRKAIRAVRRHTCEWIDHGVLCAVVPSDTKEYSLIESMQSQIQNSIFQRGCPQNQFVHEYSAVLDIASSLAAKLSLIPSPALLLVDIAARTARVVQNGDVHRGDERIGIQLKTRTDHIYAAFPHTVDLGSITTESLFAIKDLTVCGIPLSKIIHMDSVQLTAFLCIQPLCSSNPSVVYSRFQSKQLQSRGTIQQLAATAMQNMKANMRYQNIFPYSKDTFHTTHMAMQVVRQWVHSLNRLLLHRARAYVFLPPFSRTQLAHLFFSNDSNRTNHNLAFAGKRTSHIRHQLPQMAQVTGFTGRQDNLPIHLTVKHAAELGKRLHTSASKAAGAFAK